MCIGYLQLDGEVLGTHSTLEHRHAHTCGVHLAVASVHLRAFNFSLGHLPTEHPGKVMDAIGIVGDRANS